MMRMVKGFMEMKFEGLELRVLKYGANRGYEC